MGPVIKIVQTSVFYTNVQGTRNLVAVVAVLPATLRSGCQFWLAAVVCLSFVAESRIHKIVSTSLSFNVYQKGLNGWLTVQ